MPLPAAPILAAIIACNKDKVQETDCDPHENAVPEAGFFTDISDESGIRTGNFDPDPPEGTSINDHSRLAFADIDGDGYDDMVMHSLYPNALNGIPFEHLVFLNNGDGTFTDHSDASGLRDVQAGFFAFGDVDNDGDQDVFAGLDLYEYGSHTSAMYLNDGDGSFSLLEGSGVETSLAFAANALFGDFDGDADLDLFVGNGGTSYAYRDFLYLGNGDGTFEDGSSRLPRRRDQPSNGSTACDYDDDGDLDIFVATYGVSIENGRNALWENDGSGSFVDVAEQRGFHALATGNYYQSTTGYGQDPEPDTEASDYMGSNGFGIDCGDVDNDGKMDIFLSAISHPSNAEYSRKWSDPTQLLINQGGTFANEFLERGLPFNEGDVDAALADFDNDGRFDLSLSRDRKYESNYTEPDNLSWFGLMHQQADGSFLSLGVESGINDIEGEENRRMKGAQNHAWSDIDHDGDVDLLVGGRDQGGGRPNFLFRNDIGSQNRWLAIQLEGDGTNINRDAIGARVTLSFSSETIVRELKSSRGMYNSEDGRTLHFGLGDRGCDYTMEVRWPDGKSASFSPSDFPENAYLQLTYPDGIEAL
jgi:enediyne biosynthesis protein E4